MAELPPVLHHWFVDTFRTPSGWFEWRLAFTRSCAVTSMIGFAVGLGDRHLENILVDSTSYVAQSWNPSPHSPPRSPRLATHALRTVPSDHQLSFARYHLRVPAAHTPGGH